MVVAAMKNKQLERSNNIIVEGDVISSYLSPLVYICTSFITLPWVGYGIRKGNRDKITSTKIHIYAYLYLYFAPVLHVYIFRN